MDEWDKIAEGLLPYDANFGGEWARLRREAVSAKLRDMGEEIERLKVQLEASPAVQGAIKRFHLRLELRHEIDQLKAEIERLKKFYEHDHQLCLDQAAIVIEANTEVNQLRAERDAEYLEGLEEGKSIADKSYFQIGVLKYPCTEVADAIQRKIDEAKGK